MCVRACVCVRVCVCVRERERERETVCVEVVVWVKGKVDRNDKNYNSTQCSFIFCSTEEINRAFMRP